jgi:hypothetical protein
MIKHLKPRSKLEIANNKLKDAIIKILRPTPKFSGYIGLSHFRNSRAANEIW